jgi:alcohol dehydrogenase class IV
MQFMRETVVRESNTGSVALGMTAAAAIKEEIQRLGARRVFLLASATLDKRTSEIKKIIQALGSSAAGICTRIHPHVPKEDVLEASKCAIDADADMIVAIGGGSVTDAAKILTLCLKHRVRTREGLDSLAMRTSQGGEMAPPSYEGPDVPLLVVPTTLSAGEFNSAAGATDEQRAQKDIFHHPAMKPDLIVLDPSMTVHTPGLIWFSTGVRAIDHAVETLTSLRSNDHADTLAEGGLRLLIEGLYGVNRDWGDLAARLKCQIGAWHASMPIVQGVPMGASHAIGHALGSVAGVPHGYTSCVMMPAVQLWNSVFSRHGHDRVVRCFDRVGQPLDATLDQFIRSLGLPRTLLEVGVEEDQWPRIVEISLEDIWAGTNPRPMTKAEDVLELLRMATQHG